MKRSYKNVGLMVFPLRSPEWGYFVDQISSFVAPRAELLIIMTGNYNPISTSKNTQVLNIKMPLILSNKESLFSKISRFIRSQYSLSILVIRQRKHFDVIMLHFGTPFVIFPTLLCYLMKKRVVVVIPGSDSQSLRFMYPGILGKILGGVIHLLENFTYLLSYKIIIASASLISSFGIEKFEKKIISKVGDSPFGGTLQYIDSTQFSIKRKWEDREDIIGYIGRLSGEKGIIEFVEAIPQIIKTNNNARFLIVGKGTLLEDLKRRLEISNCLDKVSFTGLVLHDDIPQILNKMKFLIVPSYTEVVATTALEAMACGTICLATPVGVTRDVIVDGQTGYLLDDNQPSTIAKKLLDVWNRPEINKIQLSARKFIEENFTQQKVINRWEIILDKVLE
jgi:glycosyltransferase involved in cell wall biosynthesis